MSGLAKFCWRKAVSFGSDLKQSGLTERLQKNGAHNLPGHAPQNVHGADLIVYTAAVKDDNVEMMEAKSSRYLLWTELHCWVGSWKHTGMQ